MLRMTFFCQKNNFNCRRNRYPDLPKICIQPSSFLLSRESFAIGSASMIFSLVLDIFTQLYIIRYSFYVLVIAFGNKFKQILCLRAKRKVYIPSSAWTPVCISLLCVCTEKVDSYTTLSIGKKRRFNLPLMICWCVRQNILLWSIKADWNCKFLKPRKIFSLASEDF